MILTIVLFILGCLGTVISYLIIKPMIELILLKLKHGKEIEIRFMPILGEAFFNKQGQSQHKDIQIFHRKILQQKSGVKVLACNFILDKIFLSIVDPQMIKKVTQSPEMYKKYELVVFLDSTMSKGITIHKIRGLVFTEDQMWKDQRKIIGHQFTYENLKSRFPIIKEITQNYFQKHIKINEDVKLLNVTAQITGEVITQTFFGKEFSGLINGLSVTDATLEIALIQIEISLKSVWTHVRAILYGYNTDLPRYLLTSKEKLLLSKINEFKKFIFEAMEKREQSFEQNKIEQNNDFIQIYLAEYRKNNQKVCLDELVQQFMTFAFAGTDTTSVTSTMAYYVLSQKADLQEELRDHIKEHIKSYDDLTHQNLSKMDKLSAFIQELLRVYPPAARLFFRKARQTHKIGYNFTLKTSYIIDCGILSVQQSSKYYEKPEEFNINRWLNSELKESYAYIPFSSGPRNCIGQHMAQIELKVMIIYVLLNYKLIPDPKRELVMGLPAVYSPIDDRLVHFQLLQQ